MEKTLQALDELIAKLVNTLVSTKFWVLVATMALAAFIALKSGQDVWGALVAALTAVIGGGVYTFSKMKQNIAYMQNGQTKKISGAIVKTDIPPIEETPDMRCLPPVRPVPIVDTMPSFDGRDNVLVEAQKKMISDWFIRSVLSPPVIPDIPKPEATLYTDIVKRDEERLYQAKVEFMNQALELYPLDETLDVLKLRKDCDVNIWDRVNYHHRDAMGRYMDYGLALWRYREA